MSINQEWSAFTNYTYNVLSLKEILRGKKGSYGYLLFFVKCKFIIISYNCFANKLTYTEILDIHHDFQQYVMPQNSKHPAYSKTLLVKFCIPPDTK